MGRAVREWVWNVAAGLTGVVLCGAMPASAGASPSSESFGVTPADARIAITYEGAHAATPPALLAHTVVPATPAIAVQPVAASAFVAQGSIVRAVTPNGSQPGVFWLIAIGALLCRLGARVVRV
jgi:hypothetical protein